MAKKAKVSYALFQSRIGNVASLTTTEKNNLVGAINELNSGVGDIGSQKGAANGIASLDATGKVPAAQLPAFVDDVLEYANLAGFPATGETGKIYVAKDTNKTYRWSGSAYVVISDTIALGETSSTAYRGDNGKTAYDHSQLTNSNPHGTTAAQVGAAPAAHVGAGGTAHPLATGTVNGFSSNDYTSAEKTKLSGITTGATKTEASTTNGNIKINGAETTVFAEEEITETAYIALSEANKLAKDYIVIPG